MKTEKNVIFYDLFFVDSFKREEKCRNTLLYTTVHFSNKHSRKFWSFSVSKELELNLFDEIYLLLLYYYFLKSLFLIIRSASVDTLATLCIID
jgi:hypothetical protein